MNHPTSIKPHNSATLVHLCNTACVYLVQSLDNAEMQVSSMIDACILLAEFPAAIQLKALKKLDLPFEYTTLTELQDTLNSLRETISSINSQLKAD